MLIVNESYNMIDDIMNEAAYNRVVKDIDEVTTQLHSMANKNSSSEELNSLDKLINTLYDEFDGSSDDIPFRFNEDDKINSVKISRRYYSAVSDKSIFKSAKPYGSNNSFTIAGIKFIFGEGSIFGRRDTLGLSYEGDIISEIKNVIWLIKNNEPYDERYKPLESKLKKIANNKNVKSYEDLDRYVLRGPSKHYRNANNELWDSNFNINVNSTSLEASGAIIADAIIETKPRTYISVKRPAHQFSGVNCDSILNRNNLFKTAIEGNIEYKDSLELGSAFNNFCNAFGVNKQDLYEKYLKIYNGEKIDRQIKLISHSNGAALGYVFQMLIGGNYWFVQKDADIVFITGKAKDFKFIINSATISRSGRCMSFYGNLILDSSHSTVAKISFRTSKGNDDYPNRFFPVIDNINNLLGIK